MNLTIRNYRPGDEPAIVDLYSAAEAVDKTERNLAENDLRMLLTAPDMQPECDVFLAFAERGSELVGVTLLETWAGSPEAHRIQIWGIVHPAYRHRGVGTRLLQTAEVRAAEMMNSKPEQKAEHQLDIWCRSTQTADIALFEKSGFKTVRYFFGMQRDLNEPLPEPFIPAGLTIRTYREGDSAPLLAALNDAFQDHWGNDTFSNEIWEHELLNVPHFRPELFFMACEGDEIAGMTLCAVDPLYAKRVGRKEGHVNEVGVRRQWRKRGVASALITQGLHALKAAGMDTAILGVDADNPTGAVSLYERLGFKQYRRNHVFRKRLK